MRLIIKYGHQYNDTSTMKVKFPWKLRNRTLKQPSRTAKFMHELKEKDGDRYDNYLKKDRSPKLGVYTPIEERSNDGKKRQRAKWVEQKRKYRKQKLSSEVEEPVEKKKKISEMTDEERKQYSREKQRKHKSKRT